MDQAFTIRILEDRCTNCGLCVKDCVSGCLQQSGRWPAAVRPEWCTLCSHCVAVCPADAVAHGGLRGDAVRPVRRDLLNVEAYREIAVSRRSVRWFKPEAVSWQEVQELIDLARYSPTASNTMEVGYSVVLDRELIRSTGLRILKLAERIKKFMDGPVGRVLRRVFRGSATIVLIERYGDRIEYYQPAVAAGRDPICYDAPAMILVHYPEGSRFGRENCALAAANLVNYAHAKGFGTCYLGFVVVALEWDRKLRAKLGVPKGRKAGLALVLGRPAYRYRNPAMRPPAEVTWVAAGSAKTENREPGAA
jgi:nitroreductase/NAD-dependent dihydropyrimidine dehydrogenase PreA subunit